MPFGYHTLLLSEDGLLAFGGKPQQNGDEKMPDVPHQVPWVGPPVEKVDWGRLHSLVLDSQGGVWEAGTSGIENSSFTSNFRQVEGLPQISQIAAGYDHSAAIDMEGGLWTWSGRDLHHPNIPKRMSYPSKISKVAGSWGELIFQGVDDTLWHARPIVGEMTLSPILVEGRSKGPLRSLCFLLDDALLVDSEGSAFLYKSSHILGHERFKFRKLEIPPMVEASSGSTVFLLLDENRELWMSSGLFCSWPEVTVWLGEVSSFVSGGYHFMAHLLDGRTMVVGDNTWGQFGQGHSLKKHTDSVLCSYRKAVSSRRKSARSVAEDFRRSETSSVD